MGNEWDEYAAGWDTDPAVHEYAGKAFQALSRLLSVDNLTVFDFGCGTGALTELISPKAKEIVALDGSAKMAKVLEQKQLSNVQCLAGYLTQDLIDKTPLLAPRFDLIVASSVCGFLPDYEHTLGLLRQLLKPEGTFVQWDWLATEDSEFGLSETRVKQALASNGFTDIVVSQAFDMTGGDVAMPVLMAVAKNS